MTIKRIVSFLPSATELLYEFDVQNLLYGVTHECKYPPEATIKPIIINSVINSDMLTSKEIDEQTCKLLAEGKEIFKLSEEALKEANPDLIISQDTCEVCAAYSNHANKALEILQNRPVIHSMNPHNLDEIIKSVTSLGKILDREDKAKKIVGSLEKKISHIKEKASSTKPKVLAIEWLEPFFAAGHWIPDMVEIAGGTNMISKTGEHSRRLEFEEIAKADPDIIILMPCGFDTKRTVSEYVKLKTNKEWNKLKAVKENSIFAVDANSFFSKPSIRTIRGLEILARIIQPKRFREITLKKEEFEKLE